jgi:hypothetical protein
MILAGLNSIDKLDELEARKQKEYKEEIKRESQLLVSSSEVLVLANTP